MEVKNETRYNIKTNTFDIKKYNICIQTSFIFTLILLPAYLLILYIYEQYLFYKRPTGLMPIALWFSYEISYLC